MGTALDRVSEMVLQGRVQSMPDEVVEHAVYALLDTLGVAIAAHPMEAGSIARETAAALYATAREDTSARMLLDGRRVSLAGAAFAMATQTDNLDAHDGYNPVKGHIGCAVIPALLAAAEQVPDLGGHDALATLVAGYEVAGRAGETLHATVTDYHTSGAWNAIGAAAVVARLRGLGAAQLREALGIAEYHGPRSQMMREIATPTMLHDGSGMGALVGVSSVIMAEQGFTGAPAITLEGDEAAPFWDDLGARWIMTEQYIKPYPICRWAHMAIDAARGLKQAHGLAHDQVARIRVNTFRESAALFPGMPATTSQAQYSLGFAVAQMVVHGKIGLAQISGEGLRDGAVKAVLDKITVAESEVHNAVFPARRTADVEVELLNGKILKSGVTSARGGAVVPMAREDIVEKFFEFAAPVVGDARARDIKAAVFALADDAPMADLQAHLFTPA